MVDAVLAVSWWPCRVSTNGAVAIGANSPTMIAADRLRGFGCAARTVACIGCTFEQAS